LKGNQKSDARDDVSECTGSGDDEGYARDDVADATLSDMSPK
jgi:hypothetical protein